jgi:hypothetical protein
MFAFVTIVGGQAMSVLNPLSIALQEAGSMIKAVHFLFTPKTENRKDIYVHTAKDLIKLQLNRTDIPVIPATISDTLKNNNDHIPIHQYLEIIQNENFIIFNLAGGMSFQIGAAVNVLMKNEKNSYIYPEDNGCHLFMIKNGELCKQVCTRTQPLPLDVFTIQDIRYSVANANSELDHFFTIKRLNGLMPSH